MEPGTQQQEEQQGLAEQWANDPLMQDEYLSWQISALQHEQEHDMGQTFSGMSESKYIKKEDLNQDTGNLVTIIGYNRVNVAQGEDELPDYKFTVTFKEFRKPMVLNATNRAILQRTFGDDTDMTIGKSIVIYVDENVSYAGKTIGGIRMRAPKQKAKPTLAARAMAHARPPERDPGDDMNDDIPFN